MNEGYERLINAIIEKAVDDYRQALRYLKRHKRSMSKRGLLMQKRKSECERFFRSEWFYFLTKVDGKKLMELVRDKTLKGKTKGRANSERH